MGAIHSTKLSGNFGPKLNGSVRSNRKSFEKTGPPFEVVLFSRSDRLEFWLNGSRPISPHPGSTSAPAPQLRVSEMAFLAFFSFSVTKYEEKCSMVSCLFYQSLLVLSAIGKVRYSVYGEKRPKQPSEAMKEITGSKGRDVYP